MLTKGTTLNLNNSRGAVVFLGGASPIPLNAALLRFTCVSNIIIKVSDKHACMVQLYQ